MARKNNKIASMAAALAVALAPVPANSIGNQEVLISSRQAQTLSLQSVRDSIVFLPLDEATKYMLGLAERMREHGGRIRAEWELLRAPIKIDHHKQSTREGVMRLRQYVEICASLIDAVKIALKDIPESNDKLRRDIVSFGRAVAQVRYAIEDTFNFIESTKPPKKVSETLPDVTAEEVYALIRSEHKNLGLDEPNFNRGS